MPAAERGAPADRRPLHDDEAGAFQMLYQLLRDDLGHDLVWVVDALAALKPEREACGACRPDLMRRVQTARAWRSCSPAGTVGSASSGPPDAWRYRVSAFLPSSRVVRKRSSRCAAVLRTTTEISVHVDDDLDPRCVGLFLLGMTVMTEGLKALAGSSLRTVLSKAAATPLSGAFWGTFITLLVQSSSATTMTTIGLVSAGALTMSGPRKASDTVIRIERLFCLLAMRASLESGGGRTEVRPADFVARACRQPLAPMRPPAPRLLCRACGKCIRVGRTRRPSLERRFGISGSCRCRATLPIAGAFGKLVDQLLVHEHPIGHAELAAQAVLQVRHRQFAHRRPLPESRRCALVKRDVTSVYSSCV